MLLEVGIMAMASLMIGAVLMSIGLWIIDKF